MDKQLIEKLKDQRGIKAYYHFLRINYYVVGSLCGVWNLIWLFVKGWIKYGCFCGLTRPWPPASNQTMDDFDAICRDHDYCWDRVQKANYCAFTSTKTPSYAYHIRREEFNLPTHVYPYENITVMKDIIK